MQVQRRSGLVAWALCLVMVACGTRDASRASAKGVSSTGAGMGGTVSLEDCRGTQAEENGATLSLVGNARFSVGRVGCGVDLDGVQGAVDLGRAYVAANQSFTVAAWISLADANKPSTIVAQPGTAQSGFALRYVGPTSAGGPGSIALATTFSDTLKATANVVTGRMAVTPGRWTHVAATYDAAAKQARLYVDGHLAGAGTLARGAATAGATLLGAEWQNAALTRFFNGRIDEVVMRPSVATADDIAALVSQADLATPVRAPATPLLVRDPYVSAWTTTDPGSHDWPRFWTGAPRGMYLMARVDDQTYKLVGAGVLDHVTAAPEIQREVTPTQTRQTFVTGNVQVHLSWTAEMDMNSMARLSAPLGSVTAQAQATDGQSHDVTVYGDVSGEWLLADTAATIDWSLVQNTLAPVAYMAFHVVPTGPTVVSEMNDGPKWGEQWWAASGPNQTYQSGQDSLLRASFVQSGTLTNTQDGAKPRAIGDRWPVFAFAFSLGATSGELSSPVAFTLGQVRTPAMTYDGNALAPFWTTAWRSSGDMVADVHAQAALLQTHARNQILDRQIWRDAVVQGGYRYAALCALAFRQFFGSVALVVRNNALWAFVKEISSDGNVSTVDVLYPSMPLLLYVQPNLLRASLLPLLAYSESGSWPQAFAPHDLGASFSNASLHNDGGGENMPVEESANLILMVASYAATQPDANATAFVSAHYPMLAQWGNYLVDNTLDPNVQNQTDDFTGVIAHSSNLALKGILALGAMQQLAQRSGHVADAEHFGALARQYIAQWQAFSLSADKTHLKLTYDQDDSWSQKYNVFCDKLLALQLVPATTLALESAHYKQRMGPYGLPLDMRHAYTKLDWSMWLAASTEDAELRQSLIDAAYRYANESSSRVPLSDWYDTQSGQSQGFAARPVVGGIYALMARARLGL